MQNEFSVMLDWTTNRAEKSQAENLPFSVVFVAIE